MANGIEKGTIGNFPFFPLEFDKNAQPVDPAQMDSLRQFLDSGEAPSDLFVVSHGWNNDEAEAMARYRNLFGHIGGLLDGGAVAGLGGRRFAIAGVFWPSKKFADRDLIAGGAAAAEDAADVGLAATVNRLRAFLGDPASDAVLTQAQQLLPQIGQPAAQRQFLALLKSLPVSIQGDAEDQPKELASDSHADLFDRLASPIFVPEEDPDAGGAASLDLTAGGDVGLGDVLDGAKGAAQRLLNLFTYYGMKERAGIVGVTGLNPFLAGLRAAHPRLRLHLMGHSFGGRLVTAAVNGPAPFQPSTLTLLQAAFSHFGFASKYDGRNDGAFRAVVAAGKVQGPLLVTRSRQDVAVGVAYAVASRVAGQIAAAIGDANDRFGGIGRNGALATPEAANRDLLQPGAGRYDFSGGARVFNLNGDAIITSHGDVARPETAFAALSAVAAATV